MVAAFPPSIPAFFIFPSVPKNKKELHSGRAATSDGLKL